MGAERRSELMLQMSEDIRRVSRDAIRQRHPEYSETELQRAFIALLHGSDIARKIWPGAEIPDP